MSDDHDINHDRTKDHDHDWDGVEHDHRYDAGWGGHITVYYSDALYARLADLDSECGPGGCGNCGCTQPAE